MPTSTPTPTPSMTGNAGEGDFAHKLATLRDLLADITRSVPAAASETFDGLKHRAAAFCDNCEETVTDATHSVVKTVKAHPVKAALIVAGAGVVVWYLLHRCAAKRS